MRGGAAELTSLGMLKVIATIIFASVLINCSDSKSTLPIPKSHPAYKFYQIACAGPTTLAVCESYGGVEIFPIDYEVIEILGHLTLLVYNDRSYPVACEQPVISPCGTCYISP